MQAGSSSIWFMQAFPIFILLACTTVRRNVHIMLLRFSLHLSAAHINESVELFYSLWKFHLLYSIMRRLEAYTQQNRHCSIWRKEAGKLMPHSRCLLKNYHGDSAVLFSVRFSHFKHKQNAKLSWWLFQNWETIVFFKMMETTLNIAGCIFV